MRRMLGRLSAVRVQSVRKPGYYGDGGGLYLRVAPGGAKGWIFRYGGRGRRRDMGLGGYPAIGLAKARELAGDYRSLIAAGLDPIAARNEKRAAAAVEAAKAKMECTPAEVTVAADAKFVVDKSKIDMTVKALQVGLPKLLSVKAR